MPDGVITGGWSYVITAYSITAAGLIAYAATLWVRRKKLDDERERR